MVSFWWLVVVAVVAVMFAGMWWEVMREAAHFRRESQKLSADLFSVQQCLKRHELGVSPVSDRLIRPTLELCAALDIGSVYTLDRRPSGEVLESLLVASARRVRTGNIASEELDRLRDRAMRVELERSAVMRDVVSVVGNSQEVVNRSIRSLQDSLRNLVTLSSDMERFKAATVEQHALLVDSNNATCGSHPVVKDGEQC